MVEPGRMGHQIITKVVEDPGLYRVLVVLETGDKWNHYEISARGRHLVVKLNGQITVDTNDDKLAAGPFALQYGAGRVMFRNVRIRAN